MEVMEIHAPEGPVHNVREFAIHIGIVTIGILIALSLEGIREHIHDRYLVREAREDFHHELAIDRDHIEQELSVVQKINKGLLRMTSQFPTVAKQSEALSQELVNSRNSGYFFFLNSWQAALSTGALAHMKSEEVLQYAAAEYTIRYYTSLQTKRSLRRATQLLSSVLTPLPMQRNCGKVWRNWCSSLKLSKV